MQSATTSTTPSAPASPPFLTSQHGSTAASNTNPSSRPASLHDDSVPNEGLNGSNVPGLPPPTSGSQTPAQQQQAGQTPPPRSVPDSRRTSGMPADLSTDDQLRLAANRRSVNGSLNDITASFDRMGLAQSAATKAQQQRQQQPSPLHSPAPGATSGTRSPATGVFGTSASGQQSLLQRAMGQSTAAQGTAQQSNTASSQQHQFQQQQSGFHPGGEANLTPVFNERFLFSDDELEADDSAFVRKYNLNEDDNSFPVLIRHDSHPGMLSASSAALDLAPLSQAPGRFPRGGANASEWPRFAQREGGANEGGNVQQSQAPNVGNASSYDRFGERHGAGGRSERTSPRLSAGQGAARGAVAPVAVGNRSNDSSIPRSANAAHFGNAGSGPRPTSGGGNRHPLAQGFHDRGADDKDVQNARAGRNQDGANKVDGNGAGAGFAPFAGMGNGGERFAPAYGFESRGPGGAAADGSSRTSSGYFDAFAAPPANNKASGPGQKQPGTGAGGFGLGPDAGTAASLNGLKTPRKGELDTSTPLEDLQGEIFALCKDQHGCRYLQKKLEEGNPTYRDMIFTETFSHFAELMTDPFGNYLCQKMLEYCTDEQRNLIVESVAPDLVSISLNMHGTRAVQKTIDFLSTPRQIHSIIMALSMNVVPLIKDLNGNHVVQKCLNRLGSSDNQFIYDAVAAHCVEVATHRHGCCVLQRCIDHASDNQRMQLVQEITFHALTLVQDPFGNYVVQYILDLNDPRYSEPLVRQFIGHVCNLSVQKFSSNVIEKCIRVSEPGTRKQLVDELLNRVRLEKLLRDSFANYVVQTSLDYADPVQRMQLVECIKPILPMIRNTPYGKRIQSKLQRDNIDLGPSPNSMPYGMLQAAHQQQLHAMAAMAHRQGPGGGGIGGGNGGGADYGGNIYGGGNYMSGGGPGGNGRSYSGGRQGVSHMPSPHPGAAMYGGGSGRGALYGSGGAGYGPGNGGGSASMSNGGVAQGGAGGYGRPPHNMGFGPPPPQAGFMQNNYAVAGAGSHPGNGAPFHGGHFSGQF